jgi:hypothetical protein
LPALQSAPVAQVALQAVAPQAYAPQDCVVRAGQVPSPAQLAATVSVPALHDGARHCVEAPGKPQDAALEPSQLPPQSDPSEAHAARLPCGGPEVSVVHVPALPETSHASHWPEQARSQHTPSAHAFEAHCESSEHDVPGDCFGTHWWAVPSQRLPVLQSASTLHVVLHAVAPQAYAPQECVVTAGHEPVPAQLAATVSTPLLHEALRHCVDAPG